MHECIKKLIAVIDNPEEEDIESLCKLLLTVGKQLEEQVASANYMDIYFKRLQMIVDKKSVSSRLEFMILDIMDVRKNGWKSRTGTGGPKTIAQLHKDVSFEINLIYTVAKNLITGRLLARRRKRHGGQQIKAEANHQGIWAAWSVGDHGVALVERGLVPTAGSLLHLLAKRKLETFLSLARFGKRALLLLCYLASPTDKISPW